MLNPGSSNQDELYREASMTFQSALGRLARAYEVDPDKRRDLLQDIHLSLWRSFEKFEARCSLRTWVFRVAHNTAASYVLRQRRTNLQALSGLESIEATPDPSDYIRDTDQQIALDRLLELIHRLRPLDRQIMLLYLEDVDAAAIAEITGISPGHVRTQIHRIKAILTRRFHGGEHHEP
jgi:RNA polymerase sigma-70 factor (ECF subfamily)